MASGQWVRVLPRVYRSASHPPTDDARIWAAALWVGAAGPDEAARAIGATRTTGASGASGAVEVPVAAPGALSGATAAYVLGLLPRAPLHLEVTVGTARRVQAPPGIRVRRKDLDTVDLVRRRGMRTTALPLTVLEAALAVPDAAAFVDRALQRHVDLDSLAAAYRRHRGSRGWAGLRPLAAAAHDRTAAESERRFLMLLRRSGLTGWVVNLRVGPWEAEAPSTS